MLHLVVLLDDIPIARQDCGDMNHHGDSLVIRVAVELWLHRTSIICSRTGPLW